MVLFSPLVIMTARKYFKINAERRGVQKATSQGRSLGFKTHPPGLITEPHVVKNKWFINYMRLHIY